MIEIGAAAATIDSPIEHLMACHRRIEQRLETLLRAADHLEQDRTAALAAIAKSIHFLDSSGAMHTEDEEASLFPRLRPKLSRSEIAFVDTLEAQHTQAEAIFSELKQMAGQMDVPEPPSPAMIDRYRECAERLQALYQAHIRSEDDILSVLARRALTGAEIAEISGEMRKRRSGR